MITMLEIDQEEIWKRQQKVLLQSMNILWNSLPQDTLIAPN